MPGSSYPTTSGTAFSSKILHHMNLSSHLKSHELQTFVIYCPESNVSDFWFPALRQCLPIFLNLAQLLSVKFVVSKPAGDVLFSRFYCVNLNCHKLILIHIDNKVLLFNWRRVIGYYVAEFNGGISTQNSVDRIIPLRINPQKITWDLRHLGHQRKSLTSLTHDDDVMTWKLGNYFRSIGPL